jgi:hypothetical protein
LIPVAGESAVGIEVRVVAHDVLIGAIEPGMVVLVAEFERSASRSVTEGLHAADELVLAKSGLIGTGHLICRDSADDVRDVLPERGDRRLLRQFLLLPLVQGGDDAVAPVRPFRLGMNGAGDHLEQLVVRLENRPEYLRGHYSGDGVAAAIVSGHDTNSCWIANAKNFSFLDGVSKDFFKRHPDQLKERQKRLKFKRMQVMVVSLISGGLYVRRVSVFLLD